MTEPTPMWEKSQFLWAASAVGTAEGASAGVGVALKSFHVMSGNLSFQVEHHLFPDMPSSRYQQIAPRVKEICERYGLPYNTGPLRKQWGTVQRTILRLAFPGGRPRPKPGPYRGDQSGRSISNSDVTTA